MQFFYLNKLKFKLMKKKLKGEKHSLFLFLYKTKNENLACIWMRNYKRASNSYFKKKYLR